MKYCFEIQEILQDYTHDIEIYIETKISYVHSRIDLQPTIDAIGTLERCIARLEKGTADSLNRVLTRNLEKRYGRIIRKLERVNGKNYIETRNKRSIEFIGNLISNLFGNPGPSDWRQINSNLLELQSVLGKLNQNSEIDHSNIDMNRHAIEAHNKEIASLIFTVNRSQNDIEGLNKELVGLKLFMEVSTLADVLESQIDFLVEVKTDGMKGFCSDRAINKDFLIENLQSLEANKAGLGPVFGSWEWREYYQHIMCTVAQHNSQVWVTLRIPLVRRSEKMVRVIPVHSIKEVLARIEEYGLEVILFRDKDADKFHVMTFGSLQQTRKHSNLWSKRY